MNKITRFFLSSLAILTLAGCASTQEEPELLLPFPQASADPGNEVLTSAIKEFLAETDAPNSSHYEFSRMDLDNDGRRDALILFNNPYGYWCGQHGCTMLVMRAHNDSFQLVNAVQPIRTPLYISDNNTNGWKDLIVRVSGRQQDSKDVAMRFDGRKYPSSPDNLPPHERLAFNEGVRVFP